MNVTQKKKSSRPAPVVKALALDPKRFGSESSSRNFGSKSSWVRVV